MSSSVSTSNFGQPIERVLLPYSTSRTNAQSTLTLPANYSSWKSIMLLLTRNGVESEITLPTTLLKSTDLSDIGTGNRSFNWTKSTRVLEPANNSVIFEYVLIY